MTEQSALEATDAAAQREELARELIGYLWVVETAASEESGGHEVAAHLQRGALGAAYTLLEDAERLRRGDREKQLRPVDSSAA